MKEPELLSVADFLYVLWKRKVHALAVFVFVILCAFVYLSVAKKTYRLSGSIYVGRFQTDLLEEGEFVAQKLQDYSFIKKALDTNGVELDIPIHRFQKDVEAHVLNEVRKIEDVGIVLLTVEYKDPVKCYEIFKALTDQLIREHQFLTDDALNVLRSMERFFKVNEDQLMESINRDEAFASQNLRGPEQGQAWPSHVLARYTISEKREFLKQIIQDRHYLKLEGEAATKSFNTRLSAEPEIPDEHIKPRRAVVLVTAAGAGAVLGALLALLAELIETQIKPRYHAAKRRAEAR
ncbi:Chain length determinant protein [Sulfidibacter corallicola]|uniref:Polysaccharide chain length determinant N-terminal domain-containing protein n=1 Tax=Sulfidibacter corallicola TaxID=2818388 RepID=A0A8A4TE41_SULCO|nr:hypothetical protein [Sulfidibacter corallicola]QTD47827.1 hypothetical protein J3U87_19745 [Sulfidibacter corallicola]